MSFFASMLAGAAGGFGQGIQQQAVIDQRERERQEAMEEKRQLALQLAQQRSDDKAAQLKLEEKIASMRYGDGGGSGGSRTGGSRSGGGGDDRIMNAKTDEEIAQAIRFAEARGDKAAAANLAYAYGRPLKEMAEEFDPAEAEKLSRRDYAEANPNAKSFKTVERGIGPTAAGAQSLNRVIAMAAGPDKYDDFMKGETQATLNDNAKTGTAGIKDPLQRAVTEQALMNPAKPMNADLSDEQQARTRATSKGSGGSGSGGAVKLKSTREDGNGQVIGIFTDGSTKVISDSSLNFNKKVADMILKMSDNVTGFRKLPPADQRLKAIETLTGNAPAPAAAASTATKKPSVSNW
jgi:hypothetical protein